MSTKLEEKEGRTPLILKDLQACKLCPNLGKNHVASVGQPNARVMVVVNRPTEPSEIEVAQICSGPKHEPWDWMCDQADMDRSEWYFTSLVKCATPTWAKGGSHVLPKSEEIETCTLTWFNREMETVQPTVVVCVGEIVWTTLAPEAEGEINRLHGAYVRKPNGRYYLSCYDPTFFTNKAVQNWQPWVALGDVIRGMLEGPA